ncbi:MAG: formate dehydrogenase accessory sulfurtransferase FdhD [Thermodesulfobacteriota bacterium]|nr:formate dehydrogenase accessory sulfurtransferase FdhD [Thermodesulfobacteriota bacterium]
MKTPTEKIDVMLYSEGKKSLISEQIITEKHVKIFLNNQMVATIACAGIHLQELAVGFLRYVGIIMVQEDIERITTSADELRINVFTKNEVTSNTISPDILVMSSGAKNRGGVTTRSNILSDVSIPANKVVEFIDVLLHSSSLHRVTHGTHCSALADTEEIIVLRDDIGRHNTIDMLSGYTLLNGIDCSDKIIVKTGRVSSEIAEKVWAIGIPIVISHSVPTSEAIGILRDAGITLIGHVRGECFKIYSNERRVQF